MPPPQISFVIPVMNEEKTIAQLLAAIRAAVTPLGQSFEVLFIDDGSTDSSWQEITKLTTQFPSVVRGLRFRRNFGKSQALSVGFERCRGQIIFTMDADLQDDPNAIPAFLEKLDEGFDLVSGWKKKRQDPITKTLPSKLFNSVTSRLTGLHLHDMNCGFKAYRRQVTSAIRLYGELHRFTPVLAHELGFRVGEVAVEHHPRVYGVSKYGWRRLFSGFLDLLTVLFTTQYLNRPSHLIGGLGLVVGVIGFGILGYLTIIRFSGEHIGGRPLLSFGILISLVSIQLISIGLLAELINRNAQHASPAHLIDEEKG
jgi:glycosyltransferase involved in cell wall biosynthesis